MTKNAKTAKKTAKKHTNIARITHQYGPKHPEVVLWFFDFFKKKDILPKIIYLES